MKQESFKSPVAIIVLVILIIPLCFFGFFYLKNRIEFNKSILTSESSLVDSTNLIKNGSFEADEKYWESEMHISEDFFKEISLKNTKFFTMTLDPSYLDQLIKVKYHPKKFKGSLPKSTVFFNFFDRENNIKSTVTYVLNGTKDHWNYSNTMAGGISYITIIRDNYKIGRSNNLIFENILKDQNENAPKIGGEPLKKEDIGKIDVTLVVWANPTGDIVVSYSGWEKYVINDIKPNIKDSISFDNSNDEELLQKPAIYQQYYLSTDGGRSLDIKVPLMQEVIYSQKVSVIKHRYYLLIADVKKEVGVSAPQVKVKNEIGDKNYFSQKINAYLAEAGWVRLGGFFEAKDNKVIIQLIASNTGDETNYMETEYFNYDNIRLIELPEIEKNELKKMIEKDFNVNLKDSKIKPSILDYKKLYSEDLIKKIEKEYQNLGIPIYDLFFDENKFYSGGIEQIRNNNQSATFKYQDRNYKVKVGIRGDTPIHYLAPTKSLRLNFKSPASFNKKNTINLLRPLTRDFIHEKYSNFIANKLGLITPEDQFIFLRINGRPYGLMYEVEQISEDFLEKKRKPISDLYGDEGSSEGVNGMLDQIYKKTDPVYWNKYAKDPSKNKQDKTNILLLVHFMNLDFFEGFRTLLDINNLIMWNIHSLIIGSNHQDYYHNNRPYFNNTSGTFEFIPWDLRYRYREEGTRFNPFMDFAFKDIVIFNQRNRALWEYLKDDKNLREDKNFYKSLLNQTKKALVTTEHYTWEGDAVENYSIVEKFITDIDNDIKNRHNELLDRLKKNTMLEVTFKKIEHDNLSQKNSSLIRMDIEPLDDSMFSSSLLQSIAIKESFSNKNDITIYQDNGDLIFNEDRDLCIFSCKISPEGNDINLEISIHSRFHYETYVNTPPFNITKKDFKKLIKSEILTEEEKDTLKNNYEINDKEENYILWKAWWSESKELEDIFKKIKYIPDYKKTIFFIQSNVENSSDFLKNIQIKAVNEVSREDLGINYKISSEDEKIAANSPVLKENNIKNIFNLLQKKYSNNIDLEPYQYLPLIFATEDQFKQKYPFFLKNKDSQATYQLSSNTFKIKETIIIPKGITVIIEPGATLKFAPKTSIIAYGKLKAVGTKENPITFTASSKRSWGVVGLVQGDSGGEFEHCIFEKGGDAHINGVYFSGMLSAYHTNVTARNCEFKLAGRDGGDDALNFKNGLFTVENSYFYKNKFDAIDFDFAKDGSILKNNYFLENGNDGIDISGSKIELENNQITQSGDKGISIGENSQAIIFNNIIKNCNFAIAGKDSSIVKVINSNIVKNNVGVAAYNKKEIYGGSKITVYNSLFEDNKQDFGIEIINEKDDRYKNDIYQSSGLAYNSKYQLSSLETKEVIKEPEKESVSRKKVFKNYLLGKLDLEEEGYKFATLKNQLEEGDPQENPYKNLSIGAAKN